MLTEVEVTKKLVVLGFTKTITAMWQLYKNNKKLRIALDTSHQNIEHILAETTEEDKAVAERVFSEENMSKLSDILKNISGYDIEDILRKELYKNCTEDEKKATDIIRYIDEFIKDFKENLKILNPNLYDKIFLNDLQKQIYASSQRLNENSDKLSNIAQTTQNIEANTSIVVKQVMDEDEFVEEYDLSQTVAPLKMKFLFRTKELKDALKKLEENNVLLLRGASGVGKTRFALQIASIYKDRGYNILCIKNKNETIYKELKSKLRIDKDNFILIDDANELTDLNIIIKEIANNIKSDRFKIVITVRDYAKKFVLEKVLEYKKPNIIYLDCFSKLEAKTLLEDNLEIKDEKCIAKILDIAKGNARMTILAGRLAAQGNLDNVYEIADLHEYYFKEQISCLEAMGENALKVAGMVAFFGTVVFECWPIYEKFLQCMKIDKETFIAEIKKLHSAEILNLYFNDTAKFADQVLKDYLVEYIFVEKSFWQLHIVVEELLKDPRGVNFTRAIIDNCNILTNIFNQNKYVISQAKMAWDKLEIHQDAFWQFWKMFYTIDPLKTIEILDSYINSINPVDYMVDLKKDLGNNAIGEQLCGKEEIIYSVLGGFKYTKYFPYMVEFLFEIYLKQPNKIKIIFDIFTSDYGIDHKSHMYGYSNVEFIVKKLLECIKSNSSHNNIVLFLALAEYYLKFEYESFENIDEEKYTLHQFGVMRNRVLLESRENLLNALKEIYGGHQYDKEVIHVLSSYFNSFCRYYGRQNNIDIEILKSEILIIDVFFGTVLEIENAENCLLAREYERVIKLAGLPSPEGLSRFLNCKVFKIITEFLIGDTLYVGNDYEKAVDIRRRSIDSIIDTFIEGDLNYILEILSCIKGNTNHNHRYHEMRDWLSYIFDSIYKADDKHNHYIEAVRSYIKFSTPLDIYPENFIKKLINYVDIQEIEKIILGKEFKGQQEWLWALYVNVPIEKFSENIFDKIVKLIDSGSDFIGERNIMNLVKYNDVFQDILKTISIKILDKYSDDPKTIYRYTSRMFYGDIDELINLYGKQVGPIEKIYLSNVEIDTNFDYDGEILIRIVEQDNNFLHEYLKWLKSKNNWLSGEDVKRLRVIWQAEDKIELLDSMVKHIKMDKATLTSLVQYLLDFSKEKTKQIEIEWMCHIIDEYANDDEFIINFFEALVEKGYDIREKAILRFLKKNNDHTLFAKLPLHRAVWLGTTDRSLVVIFEEEKEFFQKLSEKITGIKFIKQRMVIEREVAFMDKRLKEEKEEELIETFMF